MVFRQGSQLRGLKGEDCGSCPFWCICRLVVVPPAEASVNVTAIAVLAVIVVIIAASASFAFSPVVGVLP